MEAPFPSPQPLHLGPYQPHPSRAGPNRRRREPSDDGQSQALTGRSKRRRLIGEEQHSASGWFPEQTASSSLPRQAHLQPPPGPGSASVLQQLLPSPASCPQQQQESRPDQFQHHTAQAPLGVQSLHFQQHSAPAAAAAPAPDFSLDPRLLSPMDFYDFEELRHLVWDKCPQLQTAGWAPEPQQPTNTGLFQQALQGAQSLHFQEHSAPRPGLDEVEGSPAEGTSCSNFQELHPEFQKLDQCPRPHNSPLCINIFEVDDHRIVKDLRKISHAIKANASVEVLVSAMNDVMQSTDVAVRTYVMLRQMFLHPNSANASNVASTSSANNQSTTSSVALVYGFYSGPPYCPSTSMQTTFARFNKYLTECCNWIEQLQQLLTDTYKVSFSSRLLLESQPNVARNTHDIFVYVAAKIRNLHQFIDSTKKAFLGDPRRRCDPSDSFFEADKQEAAARGIHPTLHLPAFSAQLSHQVTGLYARSAMPVSSVPRQSAGSSGASFDGDVMALGSSSGGPTAFDFHSCPT